MSGGFSPFANKSKVSVTRSFRDRNGKLVETKTFPVDVDALSKGKTHIKGQKWWVYPGDRINVTERLSNLDQEHADTEKSQLNNFQNSGGF